MKKELLRLEHITKKNYKNNILVNNILVDVNLNIFKGETLGLMGENGTGKTALTNILSGQENKDKGDIYINEKKVCINSPKDSTKLGIYRIQQEKNLALNLSIAENIYMVKDSFFFSKKKAYKKAKQIMDIIGLDEDPSTLAKNLSYFQKQMVEIASAIKINAKLIIFDEATADLNYNEFKILKNIIRKLKCNGISFLFISHRIDEVIEISDRITILREGSTVGTIHKEEFSKEKIITLIVGYELNNIYPNIKAKIGNNIVKVKNVFTDKLKNVSFSLKKGEILGIAGFNGSGKLDIIEILFGLKKIKNGSIYLDNELINFESPYDAVNKKICYIPNNIKEYGMVSKLSVGHNLSIPILKNITNFLKINKKIEKFIINKYIEEFNIKTDSEDQKISELSVGNQKKVVIAKWLAINPKVMIFHEPTKGVGIADRKDINNIIRTITDKGISIIVISSELREISYLSDRILLFNRGEIICELSNREITQERILTSLNKAYMKNNFII